MSKMKKSAAHDGAPDAERRALLGVAGLVVPPTMAALLSTSMNSPAIAASGAVLSRAGSGGSGAAFVAVPAAGAAAAGAAEAPAAIITVAEAGATAPGTVPTVVGAPVGFGGPVVPSSGPMLAGPVAPAGATAAGLPRFAGGPPARVPVAGASGAAGPAGSTLYPAAADVRRISIAKAGERG